MHCPMILPIVASHLFQLAISQTIDPSTVDPSTRQKWCDDQQASCPLLCLQEGTSDAPTSNDCVADTLSYTCICSNGLQPNASEYSQTIPYYECTEANSQCVNNCPNGDSACQTSCRTAHPCGAQNPTRINTSTISTMAATTTGGAAATDAADATAAYTGFGSASTTGSGDDSSDARALVIGFGRSYGLALVFIGISAGFTFML
ncbi:MAG: hypothetical protein LQ343_004220 [Gyalolechia ehrenbergii]|nr:MAG: hypothetical protein LQ343_004220 [Gyalolechia ehrenbergii]